MPVVMDVSDRVIVIESGRILTTGRPEEVQRDPRVIAAYLGQAERAPSLPGGLGVEKGIFVVEWWEKNRKIIPGGFLRCSFPFL
ncbi:hypothetical protein [Gelria sp. Kuro-4]|uniref:ABC transporter ATP-binding protein C-terminal domain-containing protein n=1 Tax=Gelria sp. Kuro-4 TaxID=2796927 RepID=UPI001BEFEF57|nr:hypothetical protein [Gelria sp. Kuro-4]MDK2928209.1 hypothetical protein [Bacillota bacterium]BCV25587.1 hypothetical protein kuro4_23600 [Gelria sp. Kuro-4]